MKGSLKKKILSIVLVFMIVMNFVSVLMSYQNFIEAKQQFSYSTASTVAETCSLIIDVDKLGDYMNTGCRDTDYYATWNKLIDYRNTNEDIVNLSVAWFEEDGCHYIFDTDISDDGAFLGDCREYDMEQNALKTDLVDGKEINFISYSNRMDVYRPIKSSFNIPLGYVVVGISTARAEKEQYMYLLKLCMVMFVLTFLLAVYVIWMLTKSVIRPINMLSEAAAGYSDSVSSGHSGSTLSQLAIKTGDEIEHLYLSICKMEADLLSSSNNLSIAMWNSNHDSMTQLYNKRYLKDYIMEYARKKMIGAVYFDIDNLKKMNDICGHEAGDEVIKKTADFIRKHQPEDGCSFRMGGDEFLMLIFDRTEEEVSELVRRMKTDPQNYLTKPEMEVQCRIAIGYAYDSETTNLDGLIKDADKEMYKDKQSHR